jgi:hypothetical protein
VRRVAALAVLSFFGLTTLVVGASPATADTPPDPLTVTSLSNGDSLPYGTNSLTITGGNARPGDHISIDFGNGAFSCTNSGSAPGWICDLPDFQPLVADFMLTVAPASVDDIGPATHIDISVAPSLFTVPSTPMISGSTVTVTGTFDNVNNSNISAMLSNGDVGDCVVDSGNDYICTFSGVSDASGYTATVKQEIGDGGVTKSLSTDPFTVGPPPPPPSNPPHDTNPPPTHTHPGPSIPAPDPTDPGDPVVPPTRAPVPIVAPITSPTTTPDHESVPDTTPDVNPAPAPSPNSAKKSENHKTSDATKRLLEFGIAGIVMMGLGGGRGLARSALGVGRGGEVVFAWRDDGEVKRKVDLTEKIGIGDRSPTWRFPWHTPIDAISLAVPSKLAPRSPFLGRLAADGAEIRASFGTLWLLLPAAGAVLGALALADTSGHVVPPAYWLVLSITVLAIFDALAGAVATLVFFGGILLSGGFWNDAEPDLAHSVLVFLILSVLWTSLPLIGTATRPFRRLGKPSARYAWDRVADLIIASLLCAWIAQKSLEVMDLFAGVETGLEHHADQLAVVVLVMIIVRIVIEHLASIWYPRRLAAVEIDGELPPPTRAANLIGIVVRTAAYSFIGHVYIGTCWQWWLGTALFFLPQVGALVQHRFASVELLKKLMPKGIVEIFVLIVACTLAVRYAEENVESDLDAIRWAFLLLALPPALIGAVSLFGGEAQRGKRTWLREILGLVILVATIALALRGWEY